jgi:hypothetical protein
MYVTEIEPIKVLAKSWNDLGKDLMIQTLIVAFIKKVCGECSNRVAKSLAI